MPIPPATAAHVVERALGREVRSATRTTGGEAHEVFIVDLDGERVVLRANANAEKLVGAAPTLRGLGGLGLPVPALLASDLTQCVEPFAWVLLSYIPGRDLRNELARMRPAEKQVLADQVIAAQRLVGSLPPGRGYGFAPLGAGGPHRSWFDVVVTDGECRLGPWPAASRLRERGAQAIRQLEPYLRAVPPTCFLDDITGKNVLVAQGRLCGFVDFDVVCHGDPLYHVGLTAAGIVSDLGTAPLDYAAALLERWGPDEAQRAAFALYAALFGLDFLQRFSTGATEGWRRP